MPVFAVIDVGTNSVKFNVSERLADGSWRTLVDRAEVTRLGEGLREGGEFAPAAIERTADAIAGMAEEAKQQGASIARRGGDHGPADRPQLRRFHRHRAGAVWRRHRGDIGRRRGPAGVHRGGIRTGPGGG